MKSTIQPLQQLDLVSFDMTRLPGLLGMPGRVVKLSFRGVRIQVIATENPEGQRARPESAAEPVTDLLRLELLSASADAPDWPRPVLLQAAAEACVDPVLSVQRASRWASYCARVAVVEQARLNDRALLEAQLRGVWIVVAGADRQGQVAVAGERAAVAGSVRGLAHRLLDELVWSALRDHERGPTVAVRSAATR
jgi:hypothetical protein